MRAKHVDDFEADVLMYAQPLIQSLVLCIPIVSEYNDILTIINGENIYHQQADEEDKCFAIVSLLTLGVMKAPIIEEARYSAKNLHNGNDCLSFIKSIREGYEQILEKNP